MPNNIWEIMNFEDLIYLLRNAEKRFIVLSIITDNTDKNIRKIMKKIIKEKAHIYTKITFLFYTAKKEDYGRLLPMFDKDLTKYPKMFHIWNVKEILTGVLAIDNSEILEQSFEELHEVYLKGKLEEEEEEGEIIEEKQEVYKEPKKQNITETIIENKAMTNMKNNINTYHNPEMEKKKFIEKIALLRKKQEEIILDFLAECKKRKEEEENNSKKKIK